MDAIKNELRKDFMQISDDRKRLAVKGLRLAMNRVGMGTRTVGSLLHRNHMTVQRLFAEGAALPDISLTKDLETFLENVTALEESWKTIVTEYKPGRLHDAARAYLYNIMAVLMLEDEAYSPDQKIAVLVRRTLREWAKSEEQK